MSRFTIHGLTLDSEVALSAHACRLGSAPDLTIRLERAAALGEPRGQRIAGLERPGAGYSAWRSDGGCLLHFAGHCQFEIDPDLTSIVARALPAADPELVSLLLIGNVLAFVLALRARLVLHASAIDTASGAAIAIVGASGAGKSTIAAWLCAQGARLVSDDALHVAQSGQRWICYRGSTELRLRRHASAVLPSLDGAASRQSFDRRTAVLPTASTRSELPLRAVLSPRLSDAAPARSIERIGARDAFLAIAGSPRVQGWSEPGIVETQMRLAAELARGVPAYALRLQRDAPLPPGLLQQLEAAVQP
jgi:hypothetical protein